jgi:hypothetical protein
VGEVVSGDLCHCRLCAVGVLLCLLDLGQYVLTYEEAWLYIYAQGMDELDLGESVWREGYGYESR